MRRSPYEKPRDGRRSSESPPMNGSLNHRAYFSGSDIPGSVESEIARIFQDSSAARKLCTIVPAPCRLSHRARRRMRVADRPGIRHRLTATRPNPTVPSICVHIFIPRYVQEQRCGS